jgi:hypothetical protein
MNKEYKRINKKLARSLYNKDNTSCIVIYLLPCKVNLNNMWISLTPIKKYLHGDFDTNINAYEYYNCNNELGYYASYYIEINEIKKVLNFLKQLDKKNKQTIELIKMLKKLV